MTKMASETQSSLGKRDLQKIVVAISNDDNAKFFPDAWVAKIQAYADARLASEFARLQEACEKEDGEFAFRLANALEDKVYQLTSRSNSGVKQ